MTCQCYDKGCPIHEGESVCHQHGEYTLYRIDQTDETGTKFCDDCGSDASKSGLFLSWEDGKSFSY
jgi:hypothetical protein